jgi:hypothetical protein
MPKPTRRSRRHRKGKNVPRAPRATPSRVSQALGDSKIFTLTKLVDLGSSFTSTSVAAGLYAISFKLSDLSEYVSFTNVWDQYRIDFVEIMLLPESQPTTTASTSVPYANLIIVNDFDDASALANWALHLNYENATILSPGRRHTRKIKPHAASLNNVLGTPVSAFNITSPWIDSAQPSVLHFGFKVGVQQSTSTNISLWYPYYKYTCSFRNVR